MEIPQEGPSKPPQKRVRIETGPRLTGVQREVQALISDSHIVPPIPIVDTSRYKAKPTYAPRAFKTRKWEERRFVNGARTDGLTLRHWKHAAPTSVGQTLLGASTNGPNIMPDGNGQATVQPSVGNEENIQVQRAPPARYDDEFPMEKFNVKATVPSYTPEQYEAHFISKEWTKEETDYLMDLCRDFDLRWIVVADRYEPTEISFGSDKAATVRLNDSTGQTNGEHQGEAMVIDQKVPPTSTLNSVTTTSDVENSIKPSYPSRSLESLKSRYYTIASKMLSITTPPDTMTPSEFALWEKMKNFDARTEEMRKSLAEKLFSRTKEEADEERVLLEELGRITKNEEEFLKMRKELYHRLETPMLARRAEDQGTATSTQGSLGLGNLLSTLLNKEKRFKRPGMIDTSRANSGQDGNGEAERGTAGTANDRPRKQTWEKGQHPNQYTARRNTMDSESANGDVPKKTGSMSQALNVRMLTPAEEAKYGVAHPQERITSGVQFRHEKASKIVLSKSAAQMAKIQAALVELGIPVRLLMPTERVAREYERLVADIVLLLDARRGVERVGSEVKVLEESRRMRLGLPKEAEEADDRDKMDVDQESKAQDRAERSQEAARAREDANADENGEDGDCDGDGDSAADVAVEDDEDEDEDDESQHRPQINGVDERTGPNKGSDEQELEQDDGSSSEEEEDEDEDNLEKPNHAQPETSRNGAVQPSVAAQDSDQEEEAEDEEEEEEEEEADELAPSPQNNEEEDDEQGEEEDEEEEEEEADVSDAASGAENDNDDEAEAEAEGEEEEAEAKSDPEDERPAPPQPQPPSVPARLHKRSASVISDGSRAGSNRSGVGRKKGRR